MVHQAGLLRVNDPNVLPWDSPCWLFLEVQVRKTHPLEGKGFHKIDMKPSLYTRVQTVSIPGLHQAWL